MKKCHKLKKYRIVPITVSKYLKKHTNKILNSALIGNGENRKRAIEPDNPRGKWVYAKVVQANLEQKHHLVSFDGQKQKGLLQVKGKVIVGQVLDG